MDRFTAEKSEKLSKAVGTSLPSVSFQYLQKLLRKKDVKINGKRVSKDVTVTVGDEIVLYTEEAKLFKFIPEILFQDENILVVVKPKGMASNEKNSLEEHLRRFFGSDTLYVAHRLDTNTEGVQLVARSELIFEALKRAFKAGEIEKKYVCIVVGSVVGKGVLKAYMKKDAEKGVVTVFDKPVDGAVTAITEYKAIANFEGATKLEVDLKTGRTHQIRAHMQFIDHPIIGDSKYGDYKTNEKYREKSQSLKAYRIKINIKSGILSYLNEKVFQTDTSLPLEKKLIEL